MVTRKEDTPTRKANRKYEETHKEERRNKCGNFQTMIPRELLNEINSFLKNTVIRRLSLYRRVMRSCYLGTILTSPNLWTVMMTSLRVKRKTAEHYKVLITPVTSGIFWGKYCVIGQTARTFPLYAQRE